MKYKGAKLFSLVKQDTILVKDLNNLFSTSEINVDWEQPTTGDTALIIASSKGKEKLVEYLLKKGANVNLKNLSGNTPLTTACHYGHNEVVKLLMKYNANINVVTAKGNTPFTLAKNKNDILITLAGDEIDTLEELLKNDNNLLNKINTTDLLSNAFKEQKNNLVKFLLEHKTDINIKNNNGHTAFYYAKDIFEASSILEEHLKKQDLISPLCKNNNPQNLIEKLLSKIQTDLIDNDKQNLCEKIYDGISKVLKNKVIYKILDIATNSDSEIFCDAEHGVGVGGASPL